MKRLLILLVVMLLITTACAPSEPVVVEVPEEKVPEAAVVVPEEKIPEAVVEEAKEDFDSERVAKEAVAEMTQEEKREFVDAVEMILLEETTIFLSENWEGPVVLNPVNQGKLIMLVVPTDSTLEWLLYEIQQTYDTEGVLAWVGLATSLVELSEEMLAAGVKDLRIAIMDDEDGVYFSVKNGVIEHDYLFDDY